MVIVQDAEGAGAHDVHGDTETESLFILEETASGEVGEDGILQLCSTTQSERQMSLRSLQKKDKKPCGLDRHKNLQEGHFQLDTGKE